MVSVAWKNSRPEGPSPSRASSAATDSECHYGSGVDQEDAIVYWVERLWGISSERQLRAQKRIAEWDIGHISAALSWMHKARHTAGQRMLDKTGNLKAVQKLLGHSSIQTTADIYTDWDIDQLTASLSEVLLEDEN
jgi:site-specific recombinase XerC